MYNIPYRSSLVHQHYVLIAFPFFPVFSYVYYRKGGPYAHCDIL